MMGRLTGRNNFPQRWSLRWEPTIKPVKNFIIPVHGLPVAGQCPPMLSTFWQPPAIFTFWKHGHPASLENSVLWTELKCLSSSSLNAALETRSHCSFGAADISAVCYLLLLGRLACVKLEHSKRSVLNQRKPTSSNLLSWIYRYQIAVPARNTGQSTTNFIFQVTF